MPHKSMEREELAYLYSIVFQSGGGEGPADDNRYRHPLGPFAHEKSTEKKSHMLAAINAEYIIQRKG